MNDAVKNLKVAGAAQKWRISLFLIVVCACIFFLAAMFGRSPLQWMAGIQSIGIQYIEVHPVAGSLLFVSFYTLVLSCGFPGGALFALLGGFLFGIGQGVVLVFCGLAISAALIRVITTKSRMVVGNQKHIKLASWFAISTKKHPLVFPLLIRIVPLFPFFWLNLFFSMIKQSLSSYILTALLGALPTVLALIVLGANMQSWLGDEHFSVKVLFSQPIFIASWLTLAGLAIVGYCLKRFGRYGLSEK